jgi:hypothetical protein
MTDLVYHIEAKTWAYISPHQTVLERKIITNSPRLLYVGGPGTKAQFKIGPIPTGTELTLDKNEVDEAQNYSRIYSFTKLFGTIYVPEFVTTFLKEHYPGINEEWQLWFDNSGANDIVVPPVIPTPVLKHDFEFVLFGFTVCIQVYKGVFIDTTPVG